MTRSPTDNPTQVPEINTLLDELLSNARLLLQNNFVGMYLEGSLASGDFDRDSDIDFIVVTGEEVTQEEFLALQAMHDRLAASGSGWAIQLEGSYISRAALCKYDPARADHPNIERGPGERLKRAHHDADWVIHRQVMRDCGISLAGPAPDTLLDPIPPGDLRQAVRSVLRGWWAQLPEHPERIAGRGYQSYAVLTLCRILYTLEYGTTASKRTAAQWVQGTDGGHWSGLIGRAWAARHHPEGSSTPEDIEETMELLQYTLGQASGAGSEHP